MKKKKTLLECIGLTVTHQHQLFAIHSAPTHPLHRSLKMTFAPVTTLLLLFLIFQFRKCQTLVIDIYMVKYSTPKENRCISNLLSTLVEHSTSLDVPALHLKSAQTGL